MGVMEQKTVAAAHDPMPPYPSHELRLGPLVHDDHVRAVEHIVQVEIVEAVGRRPQIGEGTVEAVDRLRAVLRHQMAPRPAVERLADANLVSSALQLANDAAQEMRIAVVPVGNPRVIDNHKAPAPESFGCQTNNRS